MQFGLFKPNLTPRFTIRDIVRCRDQNQLNRYLEETMQLLGKLREAQYGHTTTHRLFLLSPIFSMLAAGLSASSEAPKNITKGFFYGAFVLFFAVALKVLLVDLPRNSGQLFKDDRARLLVFLRAIGHKREEMGLEEDPRLAEAVSSELSSSDRLTTREDVSRFRSN